MPQKKLSKPPRETAVFINCPFDREYQPLLRAICDTVMSCGFEPRCALDSLDSGAFRFAKILDLMCECDFAVHDISRIELDEKSGLPRFNMPLELGADLGLRLKGGGVHPRRRSLILDSTKHRYDVTLSDLAGIDLVSHEQTEAGAIRAVRNWLNGHRIQGSKPLPGARALIEDYQAFKFYGSLITNNKHMRLDPFDELTHPDFLSVALAALDALETDAMIG